MRGFSGFTMTFLVAVAIHLPAKPVSGQLDTSFTYQGELAESGSPASGVYDLDFGLWDDPAAGVQIGVTATFVGVPVTDGRFTIQLDFGANALDNTGRWLEIIVDGYILIPRQPITRSPYSIQTRGIFVDDAGRVGLGTTNPQRQLDLEAGEANLRLTATDTTPGATSALQFKASAGPSIFHPLGAIEFYNELDELRAMIAGNKAGANAAQLNFSVTPGEIAQLRLTSSSVRARDELQVVRGVDLETAAEIGSDGADSFFQLQGGNVGIGTDTPLLPLHLFSTQPYVRFDDADGGSTWAVGVQGSTVGFNIQQLGVGTRFVISEGGDVGIGTIYPDAKLDIEGTAGVDGIRFPDETLQTTAAPRIISAQVYVNPPVVLAGGSIAQIVVIPGVAFGDAVVANPGGTLAPSVGIGMVRVWNTDQVLVNYINSGDVDRDPSGSTWQFRIIK